MAHHLLHESGVLNVALFQVFGSQRSNGEHQRSVLRTSEPDKAVSRARQLAAAISCARLSGVIVRVVAHCRVNDVFVSAPCLPAVNFPFLLYSG